MSATRGLRVALVGATGAVGAEVLTVLDASSLRVGELVAVAGEDSLGTDIEFQGEVVPVHAELPALLGLDAVLCCAPRAVAPDVVRAALHAEVPCIDLSGAFADRAEVPLVWGGEAVEAVVPLQACPPPTALVWRPLLSALAALAPLERVDGTVLEAASAGGRRAMEALSAESLALFNQQEPLDAGTRQRPRAFDLAPDSGAGGPDGRARERALREALGRGLGAVPALTARWIQVPVFLGEASSLVLRFGAPLEAGAAAECLAKAAEVELWEREGEGPNLRAVAGRDAVIAAAPEPDPDDPSRLRLWAAADVMRLAAVRAVAALAALPRA